MGIISFNGVTSTSIGLNVEHYPDYEMPERDYTITHVPGRNGDVILDAGSYQNVERSYEISMGSLTSNAVTLAHNLSKWLHTPNGYAVLEDDYEPDYYRMAAYYKSENIENVLNRGAKGTITFLCKPQRYLKTGSNTTIVSTSGMVINNPTEQIALPTLTVYGTGPCTITVGGYSVDISDIDTSITIDSALQDAYSGQANRNSDITISSDFPLLHPGNNTITYTQNVNYILLIPNWWTL